MALRFRKSFKLAPGIRWNVSGSGSSWTIGPRGASIGIGKRGTFLNSGIPGTGLYARERLSGPSAPSGRSAQRSAPETIRVSLTCSLADDGTLQILTADGSPAPERLVEMAKRQNKDAILNLIRQKCEEINRQIDALGELHHDTPPPVPPVFSENPFPVTRPSTPSPRRAGWLDKLLPGRRKKIEQQNSQMIDQFNQDCTAWEAEKAIFDAQQSERRLLLEKLIYQDVSSMERFLEERLAEIVWPRETIIALDISDDGLLVALDVDLPELEDMPNKHAQVPARGMKLSVKELTAAKVQKLYAEHVQGIVFRLVGEVFAALPTAKTAVVSGYSQRRDRATAQVNDEYLVSVRVMRDDWTNLDFTHLDAIDVVEALQRFDLRRDMLKSGVLRPIEPHSVVPERV